MVIASIFAAGIMSISGIFCQMDEQDVDWNELAPLLVDQGFDTVFYLASSGPDIRDEGLLECLEACRPLGIEVHAWVVMWKISPVSIFEQGSLIREGRLLAPGEAALFSEYMNPADHRNVELMAGTCLRIAAEYTVEGIYLDLRFNTDSLSLSEIQSTSITDAVAAVRDSLNRINRVVQLSVAVEPAGIEMQQPVSMWYRWLQRGYIDFAVAMNFTHSDSEFTAWGTEQLELAGDNTLLCGIGTVSASFELTGHETRRQIALAEQMGFDGYAVYQLCEEFLERASICNDFYLQERPDGREEL
jgi:hypothetical protein